MSEENQKPDDQENNKPDDQGDNKPAAPTAEEFASLKTQLEKATGSITALESKNTQLIDEKRNAEKKARDAKTQKAHDDGDLETVRTRITEEFEEKYGDIVKDRDAKDKQLNTLLIDGGLKDHLTQAGVSANLIEAVQHLIKGKHASEVKDGTPLIDGQPLGEFVKTFVAGEHGKNFLKAADNAGGGAGGSGSGGTPTGKKISQMSISEKTKFVTEHGKDAFQAKLNAEINAK